MSIKIPFPPQYRIFFEVPKWMSLLLDRCSGRRLIYFSVFQATCAVASPSLQEGIVSRRSQPASQIPAGMEARAIPLATLSSATAKTA